MKEQLFSNCKNYLDQRIQRILTSMADLEESMENESKSSAGDKYETGREMINMEYAKLSGQLSEFKKLEDTLLLARRSFTFENIQLGTYVKTTGANYFIAIPAGEITVENEKFYAIGVGSPVAQAMMGKRSGETFIFNGIERRINSIG